MVEINRIKKFINDKLVDDNYQIVITAETMFELDQDYTSVFKITERQLIELKNLLNNYKII